MPSIPIIFKKINLNLKKSFQYVDKKKAVGLRLNKEIQKEKNNIHQRFIKGLSVFNETQGEKLAQKIYWFDRRTSEMICEAFEEVFGRKLFTGTKKMNVPCIKCKKPFKAFCTNWKYINKKCLDCRHKESERKRKENLIQIQERDDEIDDINAEIEIERLQNMPYKEYLQTDHWQNLRKWALKKACYRCQVCNAQGKMNVHHRTYERRGHEYLSDLTVLCDPCHEKHHNIIPAEANTLPIMEAQQ